MNRIGSSGKQLSSITSRRRATTTRERNSRRNKTQNKTMIRVLTFCTNVILYYAVVADFASFSFLRGAKSLYCCVLVRMTILEKYNNHPTAQQKISWWVCSLTRRTVFSTLLIGAVLIKSEAFAVVADGYVFWHEEHVFRRFWLVLIKSEAFFAVVADGYILWHEEHVFSTLLVVLIKSEAFFDVVADGYSLYEESTLLVGANQDRSLLLKARAIL